MAPVWGGFTEIEKDELSAIHGESNALLTTSNGLMYIFAQCIFLHYIVDENISLPMWLLSRTHS